MYYLREDIMKIRTIIFGSIFACVLMLLAPSVSAIELKTISDNMTDYNENELITTIKDRIEQLKVQNPDPKFTLNGDDPDGPFEGGLDDPRDWLDLYFGIIYGYMLALFIKHHALKEAFATGNIYTIIIWIIDYELYTYYTLIYLGDAFDIIDPDEDGY
jgi:hypothetical protein